MVNAWLGTGKPPRHAAAAGPPRPHGTLPRSRPVIPTDRPAGGHTEARRKAIEEDAVGREQIQSGKLLRSEPTGLLALVTDGIDVRRNAAFHEVQADGWHPVGVLDGAQPLGLEDLDPQLFSDLAPDAVDPTLAGRNLAAGELPLPRHATPWRSRGQEQTCSPADDSRADVDQQRYFRVPTTNCARRFLACCDSLVAFGTAGLSSP